MRSGGMMCRCFVDRWIDRVPWSPMVIESLGSSRSPISTESSWRSWRRGAAEDDLHDGGVPDRAGSVLAPPVACLRQRLKDGHRRDPGAAAFGHQRRERRQGRQVPDFVEGEQ